MRNIILPKLGMSFSLIVAMMVAGTTPARADDDDDLILPGLIALNAASGETTVNTSAANIEGELLFAGLVGKATKSIWDAVDPVGGQRNIVPTVGEVDVNFASYSLVKARLESIITTLDTGMTICAAPRAEEAVAGVSDPQSGGSSLTPRSILDAVAALTKADTTLTQITVSPSDQLVLNSLATQSGAFDRMRIAQDVQMYQTTGNSLWDDFTTAMRKAGEAAAVDCKKNKIGTAFITSATTTLSGLSAPGANGAPSLIEQAMRLSSIISEGDTAQPPLILRISTEHSGATLIQTKNLFTTLGAQALSFRAGIALSYRLVDPSNGNVLAAGQVRCATNPVGYRRVVSASTNIDRVSACTDVNAVVPLGNAEAAESAL